MTKHSKTLAVLWASGWFLVATVAGAQTPAKRPDVKPLFENERVRVIDVVWEPGAGTAPGKLPGDSTIGMVGVVVQGGTMEHVADNGKKRRQQRRFGDVLWVRGNSRIAARRNVGPSRIRVIQTRLKKTTPTGAYQGPVRGAKQVYENAHLIAFDQTFAPGSKSPMHGYGPASLGDPEGRPAALDRPHGIPRGDFSPIGAVGVAPGPAAGPGEHRSYSGARHLSRAKIAGAGAKIAKAARIDRPQPVA